MLLTSPCPCAAVASVSSPQVGEASPDVDPALLKGMWEATQQLLDEGKLLAGHDISDGGIATTVRCSAARRRRRLRCARGQRCHAAALGRPPGLACRPALPDTALPPLTPSTPSLPPHQVLEMAFAGNCGVTVDLPAPASDPHGPLAALFAEELGLVLEVAPQHEAAVLAAYAAAGVPCAPIGATAAGQAVSLSVGGQQQVAGTTPALRDVWEATSFQLERLQCAEENVEAEAAGLAGREAPQWRVPFTPAWTPADKLVASGARRGG